MQTAFVAYSSRDAGVAHTIFESVRKANARPLPVRYEPWPFNDAVGTPVVSPILEKIDELPFVVGDITYLNLNVVYEIGFAIGRGKRVFLIRHESTTGDRGLANSAGIFDTLGYYEYADIDDLVHRLSAHIDDVPLSINYAPDSKAQIFILEPPKKTQAEGLLVSRVKKAGFYHYRSFDPGEELTLVRHRCGAPGRGVVWSGGALAG